MLCGEADAEAKPGESVELALRNAWLGVESPFLAAGSTADRTGPEGLDEPRARL